MIAQLLDLFLHLDAHLYELVSAYGLWVYLILFLVVFAETGLVVTPFLPGDSLLFATGAIAATGALDPSAVVGLLLVAAVLGDATNYWIGHYLGPKVFTRQKSWFFNPAHLHRTHAFYEKHGGKTIIIARFVPIIRTFAPFVAGIGEMSYRRFFSFNVVGALLWVPGLVYAGYFFGNLPIVKQNFSLVILAIIGLSVLPMVVEFVRHWREKSRRDP
ncbi:MAG: DedA family protein [Candidatus Handelsmanbacteria bacterium]|nr:DedA family protein [Candidatus Handelsmanbacteria bacterium]